MKKDKIRYRSYSFRLNDKTYDKLKKIRKKKGISWNKFLYSLIKTTKH